MKIEVDGIYRNKVTKKRVIVNAINGNKVTFSQIGKPGSIEIRSIRDFAIKYEPSKRKK